MTEQEISKTVFDNIKHLYPAGRATLVEAEIADRLAFYNPHLLTNGNLTLREFNQKIDITIPFRKLKLSDIELVDSGLLKERRHVSSQ